MTFSQFPTPHCHPQSFDSASTPEAFAEREVELGTGTLTVTDHGTMAACRRVYDIAKAKKLTPVLGLEAYFRDDNCPILKAHGIESPKDYLKYMHVTLHCVDEAAFNKLSVRLSAARTERHGSELKPLFTWQDLEEIGAENVTIMSGCLVGMVQRHILRDGLDLPQRFAIAQAYYDRLRGLTRPGNWYVEVFPHRCDKNWVGGVFVTAGAEKLRYWAEKNLKFRFGGELKAFQAARMFGTKDWHEGDELVEVMNNRKWQPLETPLAVQKLEHIEDFIPNECQPWCPDGDVQLGCNRVVMMMAKKYKDPVVISDDSHYAHADEKIVQDVRLSQMGSWRFYGNYARQSSAEAFAYFNRYMKTPESTFAAWVDNNREWATRFKDFTFNTKPSLPTKFYPEKTLEHTFSLIKKHGRMPWRDPVYMERLKAEIDLLHKNGTIDLLPYFMIDEEVTSHYQSLGMLTGPGRGSAAGLLLAYLLGITHVDPIRYGLSLERFLTLDRVKSGKLPDIDQDLPTREPLVGVEKDGVRQPGWLDKRFGDHFAQISIDTTLRLRNSIKDVSRATHGRVPDIIETLTKRMQKPPQGVSDHDFVFGYKESGAWKEGSIKSDAALIEYTNLFPEEWKIVQKCLGLARQRGRHPCAYVLANKPIAEFIPLMDISGFKCTQFTAPSVEAHGGIKMDFLVLNSLSDIQDALKLVQERSGKPVPDSVVINGRRVPGIRLLPKDDGYCDIWDLPEDLAVFRDVAEGKTETVFQFNTNGAVQWLRQFNHWKNESEGRKAIDSIKAMAAFTALDRPGPLNANVTDDDGNEHNMLVEYARRARGEAPVGEVKLLSEMLPETYGIIVMQEQLQRIYQRLMGCTGTEAEEFRSNVAKKKMEKVIKAYGPWMERVGAAHGEAVAKKVWDQVVTFGQYGFNLSHAVCYSVIGYACAYLKHHHPLEWWCAVLRNATKNEINETFWRYCGHLIDLPDVATSGEKFEIVGTRLKAPTSLLQGVGETAHAQLMKYRPYASLEDFCQKIEFHCVANAKPVLDENGAQVFKEVGRKNAKVQVPKVKRGHNSLNQGVVYKLIASGALDSFFPKTQTVTIDDSTHGTVEVEFDLTDKFAAYEAALAAAQGKKRPKPVKPEYLKLGPFERYQVKKQVLPAYSQPLLPTIVETRVSGAFTQAVNGRREAWWFHDQGKIPFVSPAGLIAIDEMRPFPDNMKLWAALPAYVISQRVFTYKKEGSNVDACELILDVDGEHMKYVKWPSRDGFLDPLFKTKLAGAVVVAAVSKYREDRPFGLEAITVIQPPLGADTESESSERSPATNEETEI